MEKPAHAGSISNIIVLAALGCLLLSVSLTFAADRADPSPSPDHRQAERDKLRDAWEQAIEFYGEEDTGEWSLRIRDKNVRQRVWFEFLEIWQFDRSTRTWKKLPAEKVSTAITLPKDKDADAPPDSQVLVRLDAIPTKTPGLWYAKWRIEDIEGGTLMRVGTARVRNVLPTTQPAGTLAMAVPITLDKSELMYVPDPRKACVAKKAATNGTNEHE